MSESAEKTKRLAMVLKFMGAILAALAGPVGAWYAATAQSRADLEKGYKVLAESVDDLKKAVDQLQENEKKQRPLTPMIEELPSYPVRQAPMNIEEAIETQK